MGRNMRWGLIEWWMQRLSAVGISVFALPVLSLWYGGYLPDDYSWYQWLASPTGKLLTLIGLFGFALHSRLGMWVVITDYVPKRWQKQMTTLLDIWLLTLTVYGLHLIWVL